mgnify:CR=1 FL=1
MSKYYEKLNETIKEYFKVLSKDFPEFLYEYIDTPPMQRIGKIGCGCGTDYTKVFNHKFFYTNLEHSIGVALIVWNFTKDKKQTLAGLFHDIATPVFKHCIDFMNGDHEKQESTEELTTKIISESKEIMALLNRDGIKVEEVADYHIYPIADNDTPKLSADRLEYSLSNALFTYRLLDSEIIKEIYDDIEIQTNEEKEIELGFKTKKIARNFVKVTSRLSVIYREDRTRYSMQLIADILKKLSDENKISKKDLYELKESEVIDIIESSKYNDIFNIWKNAKKVKISKEKPKNIYYVHHGAKIRYIDPLFNGKRISKCCKLANKMIKNNLSYNMDNYVYLNFNF